MNLYYIVNARMPTEKAHGIQVAKMCEAFEEAGITVTLIVPRRVTDQQSVQEYYRLRQAITVVRLPVIDWYTGGRLGYFISSISFTISYTFFLFWKKIQRKQFILYTVDTDSYSSSALSLIGRPLFSEMHGSKSPIWPQRILFKRVTGIIAINKIIVEELRSRFPYSRAQYIVEPNGVDLAQFRFLQDKKSARLKLGISQDVQMVLYAGRFFEWKGLEILPKAADLTPLLCWQTVGGSRGDFERVTGVSAPTNLLFAGSRPHEEMATWFAAADVLLVLGTSRDTQSYRYTSPMKLFEYMAAGRPIIASKTPALQQIVNEHEVIFYQPDDAVDLARAAEYAVVPSSAQTSLITAVTERSLSSSWRARAERIIAFIVNNT